MKVLKSIVELAETEVNFHLEENHLNFLKITWIPGEDYLSEAAKD